MTFAWPHCEKEFKHRGHFSRHIRMEHADRRSVAADMVALLQSPDTPDDIRRAALTVIDFDTKRNI